MHQMQVNNSYEKSLEVSTKVPSEKWNNKPHKPLHVINTNEGNYLSLHDLQNPILENSLKLNVNPSSLGSLTSLESWNPKTSWELHATKFCPPHFRSLID